MGIAFAELIENSPEVYHLRDLALKDIAWNIKLRTFRHSCRFCNIAIMGSKLVNKTPYCSTECYRKCPLGKKLISDIKTKLYSDPEFKKNTELKKTNTCRKNLGVDYPMQCPEVFAKQEKSSYQAYEYKGISGLRGYEKHIVDWLIDKHNLVPNIDFIGGVNAMSLLEQRFYANSGFRYPDIYVIPWNTYIEVKGIYTLSKFENFEAIYEEVNDKGSDYICFIYEKGKIFQVEPYTRKEIPISSTYLNYIKVIINKS